MFIMLPLVNFVRPKAIFLLLLFIGKMTTQLICSGNFFDTSVNKSFHTTIANEYIKFVHTLQKHCKNNLVKFDVMLVISNVANLTALK